jgi:hypothetical protein
MEIGEGGSFLDYNATQAFIWLVSLLFACAACYSSVSLILQHLRNYVKPELQRHVIRILWMVPIYASQ